LRRRSYGHSGDDRAIVAQWLHVWLHVWLRVWPLLQPRVPPARTPVDSVRS